MYGQHEKALGDQVGWPPHQSICGLQVQFGVQVPDNPKHAYLLDKLNGETQLPDANDKELAGINEFDVFKVLEKGAAPPPGYKRIL